MLMMQRKEDEEEVEVIKKVVKPVKRQVKAQVKSNEDTNELYRLTNEEILRRKLFEDVKRRVMRDLFN